MLYSFRADDAICAGHDPLAAGAGVPACTVALRPGDLARPGWAGHDGALVAAGAAPPAGSGEMLVFCHPVTCAPAAVRRSGEVQAAGWLPDHVRLGVLEQHLGEGVIEDLVAASGRAGPHQRRRVMSLPLTARLVLAMTLMPDACYREAMARLAGLLAQVPWRQRWQVPSSKVITSWRRRLGAQVMEELFWRAAGPVTSPGRGAGRWRGLELCAIDGFQVRLPATPANREAFGSPGTADDSAPFPQLRAVVATARAGRAMLGAAMDASTAGEQTLTARMADEHPGVFCPGRCFLVDRNFLGHELITAIAARGAHLVMRVKQGISLHHVRWLPDGSQLAYLNAPDRRSVLMVRVVEYNVEAAGRDEVSELFCLATTLLDYRAYPAREICDAYPQRWSASETTIGENKTTITDAGPSRGPILRSREPELARQEFWAWLTAAQLVRKASGTAAGRAADPVHSDQVSFTAMRHEAARSLTQTLVTAATSVDALTAAAATAARSALSALITTGRGRYRERRRKHEPAFPHTSRTIPAIAGPATIALFRPASTPDTS